MTKLKEALMAIAFGIALLILWIEFEDKPQRPVSMEIRNAP